MSRDAPIPDDTILASSGIEFQRYVPEIIKGCNGLSIEEAKQDVLYLSIYLDPLYCNNYKASGSRHIKGFEGGKAF